MNKLLKVLLGTGLYLLDQSDRATKDVRARAADRMDDLREAAQDKYETASDRVARAASALCEDNDSHAIRNSLGFIAGLGIGAAVALLFAPATGDETRAVLSDRAQEFGNNVRKSFSGRNYAPSGAGD